MGLTPEAEEAMERSMREEQEERAPSGTTEE